MSNRNSTVASSLADVRLELSSAGIPDSAAEARTLVRYALNITQASLLTNPETQVSSSDQVKLDKLVARRVWREPLQYITGEVDFYGRVFTVDSRVLIPRPETELLIEQALLHVRDHGIQKPRILDIGTGSGILAVTMAAELPGASVVATDISPEALAVASENAVRSGVDGRIEFRCCSMTTGVTGKFDILLCNPPYVLTSFLNGPDVQPELAYEPRAALDGGEDGMLVYGELLARLSCRFAEGGMAAIEIDPPVAERCVSEAKRRLPQAAISVLTDLSGLERCMVVALPGI